MKSTITEYVFVCPVHGLERGKKQFCYQAFRPENQQHWEKREYTEETVHFWPGELKEFLTAFIKKAKAGSWTPKR